MSVSKVPDGLVAFFGLETVAVFSGVAAFVADRQGMPFLTNVFLIFSVIGAVCWTVFMAMFWMAAMEDDDDDIGPDRFWMEHEAALVAGHKVTVMRKTGEGDKLAIVHSHGDKLPAGWHFVVERDFGMTATIRVLGPLVSLAQLVDLLDDVGAMSVQSTYDGDPGLPFGLTKGDFG